MTEQEAIEELKYDYNELGKSIPCDTGWGMAIDEAYKMAIVALEKQIPITPINIKSILDFRGKQYTFGSCPKCKEKVFKPISYCQRCGQKLDWKDDIVKADM